MANCASSLSIWIKILYAFINLSLYIFSMLIISEAKKKSLILTL